MRRMNIFDFSVISFDTADVHVYLTSNGRVGADAECRYADVCVSMAIR